MSAPLQEGSRTPAALDGKGHGSSSGGMEPGAAPGRVDLTLPWAVLESVNQRTNPAGWGKLKGRQFLTASYRGALSAARSIVSVRTLDVRSRGGGPLARPVFESGPVEVALRFYQPDRRRRDCGNYVKLVEDACTGLVYGDDSQIKRQSWEDCGVDRGNPRVELVISALTTNDAQNDER